MAEAAEHLDAGSQQVEQNLEHAASAETVPHAGTHAPGGAEHHVDPSALGLDATAWVSLAMVIFLSILLWKKVPGAIGGSLDKRIAAIRAQLDEATQLRAEAEALKAEYEAKMSAAAKEADDMRVRAEEEAEHIVAQAKEDASNLILRRKKMAEDKIAAAERAAVAEVRAKVAKAASTAAATLIAEHHDAAADKALVDGTIKGLSALN
ncbi:MAG: F0F1 ATP synthase subunit B [Alphaproteobacteria bacterium]|nr:F0F1 ATP synthase subunit B [Alphaproteobacteria bacterium]